MLICLGPCASREVVRWETAKEGESDREMEMSRESGKEMRRKGTDRTELEVAGLKHQRK